MKDIDFGLMFAHYGEEREVDAEDEEKQVFAVVRSMVKDLGYAPDQVELVRKSDNYVSAVIGDFDVARIKFTKKAKWVIIPYAEPKAEKHHIQNPEDVKELDALLAKNLEYTSKYIEIKKEEQ